MKSKDFFPTVFSRYARPYREYQVEVPLGRRMVLEAVAAEAGERAVDLGCGPGTLTLPLADAVGPDGRVLAIDLADGMLELVRESAPPWVETQRMDIGELHLPSGAFDVAVSGHAYQFVSDLPHALSEARRVLAPGGRFAASVPVGGRRAVHDLAADLIDELPAVPEPDDRQATYETLSDPGRLAAAMSTAGFVGVDVQSYVEPISYDDIDGLVNRTVSWWGFAWRLDRLPDDERERFLVRMREALDDRIPEWPYVVTNTSTVFAGRA